MALIATWHPSYAFFSNPYEWGAFDADLQRFARLTRGATRPGPHTIGIRPTVNDLRRIALRRVVAVDIETDGIDPTSCGLRTIAFGVTDEAVAFRWDTASEELRTEARRICASPGIRKIFHNGLWFDHRVLARYGFTLVACDDSRDLRRAISATSPLSLRYLASIYDDADPWKEDDEDDSKGLVFTDDYAKLLHYNGHDTVKTARSWQGLVQEPDFKEARVQALYRQHLETSRIAAQMHTYGFRVHKENRAFLAWGLLEEFKEKEALCKAAVGIPGWECQPNHLRALIFKRHATGNYAKFARFNLADPVDPAMWVDPKNPRTISVDFRSLLLLITDPGCPPELRKIIDLYWDATEVWKRRSTFVVSSLVDQAIGADGYLRPGWNSCGTDTGRWSCSKPNIMNIEQFIRAMYCASPGHVLVHADKSQLELRVMAAVAQDHVLSKALVSGDVYSEDARDCFGIPPGQPVKKDARRAAKIVHLAYQYSAGLSTVFQQALAQDRNLKFSLIAGVLNAMKKRYYRTVEYWEEEQERVRLTGYSETRIMHRRRVYPREPEITEIANYPIQGTAADIMNTEIIELERRLKKYVPSARLITQLHDAVDVDTPERHAGEVERIIDEVMNSSVEIEGQKYDFPIERKRGYTWDEV